MAHKKPIVVAGNGENIPLVTFILFWQTAREVSKYIDASLRRKAEISTIQFIVLQSIDYNNGVMTPSGIAHWTNTERHNITTLLQRMKKDGLVKLERNKKNRRTINVSITDKGRVVLEKTTPIAQEVVEQVMLSMTTSDTLQLQRLMTLIRKNANNGLSSLKR